MRSLKVLLLEPHPYRLMNLHQTLNTFGIYDVRVAETTEQARGMLGRRRAVDVVICDPLACELEGMAFLEYLAWRKHVPALIILSGARRSVLEGVVDLVELWGLQVLGSLPTPANPKQLYTVLQQYREGRAAA